MAPKRVIPTRLDRILKTGDFNQTAFVHSAGTCERCPRNGGYCKDLSDHWRTVHGVRKATIRGLRTGYLTEIPASGVVDLKDLIYDRGRCLVPGCQTEQRFLKKHYEAVHLKATKVCPVCQKAVLLHTYYTHVRQHKAEMKTCPTCSKKVLWSSLPGHLKSHEGPFRCSMCKTDFANEPSCKRKEMLTRKLLSNIQCQRKDLVPNASFVSMWNPQFKQPKLVFEVLSALSRPTRSLGHNFFTDPKLKFSQPSPRAFYKTGYVRMHLVPASNFDNEALMLPTYLYSNIVAGKNRFNRIQMANLEKHLRTLPNNGQSAEIYHLPYPGTTVKMLGTSGIGIPESIMTVAEIRRPNGLHLFGWDMRNSRDCPSYKDKTCVADPFLLFQKAGIVFNKTAADYDFVNDQPT